MNKNEIYNEILKMAKDLFIENIYPTTNMANASALLFNSLKNINWAGFYLLDNNELILGPFQGKIACTKIKIGKGVCGTSARLRETIIVPNVHEFPGHIACDSSSNSEIVVPIIKNEILIGVLDIDSFEFNNFDEIDKTNLENFINILLNHI